MVTAYPGGIDNYNDPTSGDNLSTPSVLHTAQHTNVNDAVNAIETELGINPSGASVNVADRLTAIEGSIAAKQNTSQAGQANGYATLDSGAKLVQFVDAAKLNSGTVAEARLPNRSGATILGVGSGGAAIPLDAVPNLPASKTNSGVFDVARIPQLNATTAFSTGTVPAARLPSSVTANANVNVRADAADRDTIPLVDRVNGMLVWVRSPVPQMYMWNTTTSAWDEVPGGDEKPVRDKWTAADVNGAVSGAYQIAYSWTVKAGRAYALDGEVIFTNAGSSSPGVSVGFNWSGNGALSYYRHGIHTGVNAPNFVGDLNPIATVNSTSGTANDVSGMSVPAGINVGVHVAGTFICTADGTINFRWAQAASNASFPVVLRHGSRMTCRRLVQ